MNNFNWGKMGSTPAGALERKQAAMPMQERVDSFSKQVNRDLDIGNLWSELVRDINGKLTDLLDPEHSENTARDIANNPRYRNYFEDKGLGGKSESDRIAYVIATAKVIKERKEKSN